MPNDALPAWVGETPEGPNCEMVLWNDATAVQEVDLTRDEFIVLKRFLAQMRGYVPRPDLRVLTPEEWSRVEVAHQSLSSVVASRQ